METIFPKAEGLNSEVHGEIQNILEKAAPAKEFVKGSIIYHQGDTADCFYYLKKGRVSVFMTSSDGLEKTLNTALKGEILGEAAFFDQMPRVSSAKAVTKAELVLIDRKKLIELIRQFPNLAMELLEIQARRIRMLSTQIDSMTFLQADARIAQLLIQHCIEKDNRVLVLLTHEEIGSMVGVSRVTVSKILNSFVKKGLIRTHYRAIELINKSSVEKLFNSVEV